MNYSSLKKTWYLLDFKEKRTTIRLFFLMLLGTLLETLGIGLVLPALTALISQSAQAQSGLVSKVGGLLGAASNQDFIIYGILLISTVYFIKTIYLTFLAVYQSNFSFGVQRNLSDRLFSLYVHQPYLFHLNRNSAEMIRNIGSEVHYFSTVIRSLMVVTTEFLVLIGVSSLLIFIEPLASILVLMLLAITSLIFSKYSSVSIKRWGAIRL